MTPITRRDLLVGGSAAMGGLVIGGVATSLWPTGNLRPTEAKPGCDRK